MKREHPKMERTTLPAQDAAESNTDSPIWRYMDLPKFVSMVSTHTLRFTKAATFRDDPYEGFCKVPHRELPVVQKQPITSREVIAAGFRNSTEDIFRNAAEVLYVSSWCRSSESMAMWEIYGSRSFGLALKSSVARLKQAAKFGVSSSRYKFDKVHYHPDISSAAEIMRDFSSGEVPMGPHLEQDILKLAFQKRDCYAYEDEWRAALYENPCPYDGLDIDFDLDQLVCEVYVGPRAEDFFYEAVRAIMERFQLDKPLMRSTLLRGPQRAEPVCP